MLTDKICCNCRSYDGINGVQGCAPCIHQKKMVLWNDSCEDFLLTGKRLFVGTPSNADRIRSMSDEELVDIICCQYKECKDLNGECNKCLLDWLKQEAKQ